MDELLGQIQSLRQKIQTLVEDLKEYEEEKLKFVLSLKEHVTETILRIFCEGMMKSVQENIELRNVEVQERILRIDNNLSSSLSMMHQMKQHRNALSNMYNKLSHQKMPVDESADILIGNVVGATAVEDLQLQIHEVVNSINDSRKDQESIFSDVQETLYKMVENAFNHFEVSVRTANSAVMEKALAMQRNSEKELQAAEHLIHQMFGIKEKMETLASICN